MLKLVRRSASKFRRPANISDADQLLLTLLYWREYRTQYHIAAHYDISEPTCSRITRRVEDILSRSTDFSLPSKKRLDRSSTVYEVVIIDATETMVQRPKKNQQEYYSGKKKRHTLKAQLVIDPQSMKILATDFGTGREHDFALFKRSGVKFHPTTECFADLGYLGLSEFHENVRLPHKKLKGENSPYTQQKQNRRLAGLCYSVRAHHQSIKGFQNTLGEIPRSSSAIRSTLQCYSWYL